MTSRRTNVLISGASSGLGAGMARLFAADGRNLVLTARRTDRLETLRSELERAHPGISVLTYALDVNDSDQVFAVFEQAAAQLGHLDRVVVNAGLGKGARIGSGRFDANRQTAMTNFVAALAQCEAAMQHFYARRSGHLVVISSITAKRGMPGAITTYAATKAAVASLAEGIRADLVRKPYPDIAVTTLMPGYIESEMNEAVAHQVRFMVDTDSGCRAMVDAIEAEVAQAVVPAWPWRPLGFAIRHAPLSVVHRLM
ncbi:MAG: SDR family oxidoreductase [Nocardioidaceae bacterium]|nr:SDR family oxidoreductase [Nocardioidaceae bacterium]